MDAANSLQFGFRSSLPQSTSDVNEALTTGLLSLDANVLLNFYRYSSTAQKALADVLAAAGDRVWVSHQAAREFWRNRCIAIDGRSQAIEQLLTVLDKNETAALHAVDAWAKQTAVQSDLKEKVLSALQGGFEETRKLIDAEIDAAEAIGYDGGRDSVLSGLLGLLPHHVGGPLPVEAHNEALAEAERRVVSETPPGYMDASKAVAGTTDAANGDYLVWLQSRLEAERRDIPLVIVTGDEKEDWWWRHRNVLMGPRQELVDEFAEHSPHRLFMLRPVQLIENAAALHVAVPDDAALDVERVNRPHTTARWTRSAVTELLRRLEDEGWEHAEIIRVAAASGGEIDRDTVYEVAGYDELRMLRGFTRPTARITRALQQEGLLELEVEPILRTVYEGGVTAVRFVIPDEVIALIMDGMDE